ncbi:hypothetical protein [Streptomyces microflavus]
MSLNRVALRQHPGKPPTEHAIRSIVATITSQFCVDALYHAIQPDTIN